jgi:hypothetical protein
VDRAVTEDDARVRGWVVGLGVSVALHALLALVAVRSPREAPTASVSSDRDGAIEVVMVIDHPGDHRTSSGGGGAEIGGVEDRPERDIVPAPRSGSEPPPAIDPATAGASGDGAASAPATLDGGGAVLGPAELEARRALPGGGVTVPEDLPSVRIAPPAPEIVPRAPVERRAADVEVAPDGDGKLVARKGDAVGRIAHDGSITFDRPSVVERSAGIAWGLFTLDPLPLIDTITGDDPKAPAKLAILKETCDLRARMRDAADAENMATALNELRPRLRAIWTDTRLTTEARRAELFRVWDGCADDDRGSNARAIVIAFVSETIPAGHPDAFRPEELADLNRRRTSKAEFAPYRAAR